MNSTPLNDFGEALSADAEAIGQPGQRRFRLLISSGTRTACMWMEKQQLAGVGEYFRETSERLDREQPNPPPDAEASPFSAIFDLDFRIGQLGLGYIENEDHFMIQAHDVEQTDNEAPTLRCYISRSQARWLARKIAQLVSSGRPICPLCQQPMEPEGHACPRTNGHHP